MKKLFDLRFVIGAFFLAVGLVLLIYAFGFEQASEASVINKGAGGLFTIFGIFMISLSYARPEKEFVPEATVEKELP